MIEGPVRSERAYRVMFVLGLAVISATFVALIIILALRTPRKGQIEMAKQDDVVGPEMVAEVGRLFRNAVEKAATARTKKYKASNDSLREEQAKLKAKIDGLEAEFKPMATRATTAEKTVEEQSDRIRELKLTIEALQKQNGELAKKK